MLNFSDFINEVKFFEGFRSKPYRCPSGVLTNGYGHPRLARYLRELLADDLLLDEDEY